MKNQSLPLYRRRPFSLWHNFMCKHSPVVCCMCKSGDSLQCAYVKEASSFFVFFVFFFLLDGLKEKIATFRGTGAKRFSQFPIFVQLTQPECCVY